MALTSTITPALPKHPSTPLPNRLKYMPKSGAGAKSAVAVEPLKRQWGASVAAAEHSYKEPEMGAGGALSKFDDDTQPVYGLCMATKTISIETDAYALLAREKKDHTESFSRVIRRLFAERPALTAGELLDVMQEFKGKGAGPRRKRP